MCFFLEISLCRCCKFKDLETRSYWIGGWGATSVTGVLTRTGEDTQTHRRSCRDEGRDRRAVSMSQGIAGAPRSWDRQGFCPGAPEHARLC